MTHITFDPYIPLALWVPLALATAAMLAWYAAAGRRRLPARRWWAVVALMALAAAVPLLVLLNPTWLEQVPPPAGKPLLTVLVDRSASMATRDAPGGETRYQAGAALATAVAGQLKDQYEVRLRWFAATSAPCSPEALAGASPDGAATDLAAAVQGALEDDRPQGQAVLLLSDGIHNVGGAEPLRQAAAKARAMAVPVYAKTIGGPAVVNDLEVTVEQPQELAFAGQRVPVAVSLRQRGKLGAKTKLSLLRGDEVVEKRDVALRPDDAVEEVFYVSHKQSGLYRYEVRAEALPGEAATANNAAPLLLRVIDQPIRMLLLEGKPYWDTKFLVRTLSNDPSVELTSVVQLAEGRLLRRKIPRRPPPAEWQAASLAGRSASEGGLPRMPAQQSPSRTTRRRSGGMDHRNGRRQVTGRRQCAGLLSSRGPRAQHRGLPDRRRLGELAQVACRVGGVAGLLPRPPASQIGQRLGELMPVRWTPAAESYYSVQLTGTAQALHWLPAGKDGVSPLAELPPLATAARPEAAKALSVVLATGVVDASGQPAPVISYQPVGNGRVVVVEGAGMWRWAFLPPERQKQEGIYGSLWQSLVRWLVAQVGLLPSQRLALRTDSISFNADESVTATLLARDWKGEPPQVELSGGPLDRPRTLRLRPAGQLSRPVPRRPGPAGRGAIRASRARRRRAGSVVGNRLRGPPEHGRAARRPRPAGRDEDDCPGKRRGGPGERRAAAAGHRNSISTSPAPAPSARRGRWPGTGGGP